MKRLRNFSVPFVDKLILYPTPSNLTYFYSFGALAGVALVIQLITGFFLVLYYIPSIHFAFEIGQFINRDILFGWLLRIAHANGASLFFVVVYFHIVRNLFFTSYIFPRAGVWYTGVILFLLLIITAFLGYVLPWGQMSYWAATVISSLISTIPAVGEQLLIFLWGGLVLDQSTLTRIFGLHYILPFVILALSSVHIFLLHQSGSTNPLVVKVEDTIPFHPYFTWKDLVIIWQTLFFFLFFVGFLPDLFGHPDNFIPANPGVTPLHIVPEWYFLPFYGILRSIPSKVGGVLLLASAILILFLLPTICNNLLVQGGRFRPVFQLLLALFFVAFLLLGWSGGQPIEEPFYSICQLTTLSYFLFFSLGLLLCRFTEYFNLKEVE